MTKVVVIGAAGRMGQRLVTNIVNSDDLELAGAIEWDQSPMLGIDAASVAGLQPCGVPITTDVDAATKGADAIIDFSTGAVLANAKAAVANGCSVTIGTTALGDEGRAELQRLADAGAKIVFASNMSVGVNLLFHLTKQVSELLDEEYDIEIVEMHHNQKLDSPSGTAVTLGERACEGRGVKYDDVIVHGREGMVGKRPKGEIGMHGVRGGDVVGDHTVMFATNGERLELTHKASSRDTFANGALRSVRWLAKQDNAGLYDMQDVLSLR